LYKNSEPQRYQYQSSNSFSPFAEMYPRPESQPRTDVCHDECGQTYYESRTENFHSEKTERDPNSKRVDTGCHRQPHETPAAGRIEILNTRFLTEGLTDHVESEQKQNCECYPVVETGGEPGQTFSAEPSEGGHHGLKQPEMPGQTKRVPWRDAWQTRSYCCSHGECIRAECYSGTNERQDIHSRPKNPLIWLFTGNLPGIDRPCNRGVATTAVSSRRNSIDEQKLSTLVLSRFGLSRAQLWLVSFQAYGVVARNPSVLSHT